MSEATQWKNVKSALSLVDPVRVDNSAGPGTPDVNFGGVVEGERIEGWLELKWIRNWPAREETPLRVDHFTPQQRIWLRRRWIRGGVALLLIQVGREWLLFDGLTAAKHLGHKPRATLQNLALYVWSEGLNSGELIRCLRTISRQENASISPASVRESVRR